MRIQRRVHATINYEIRLIRKKSFGEYGYDQK